MPTRAVLFDLDGTLLDTEALYTEAAARVCARHGATYELTLKRAIMGGDTLAGATRVVATLQLPITPHEYVVEREAELLSLMPGLKPMPHAIELVAQLAARGVPMAIATSGHRAITAEKLALVPELGELIPTVVCGDDLRLANPKPAPDIYLLAAQDLHVPVGACAGLEDSMNGVLSCVAAGLRTIALVDPRWGFDPAAFAQHASVVSSLAEVSLELLGLGED
jgi:HAD superfamily hydrolase (TIGR01509 family)